MRMSLLEYSGRGRIRALRSDLPVEHRGRLRDARRRPLGCARMTSSRSRQSSATCPQRRPHSAGPTRVADAAQGCYVADTLSTGGSERAGALTGHVDRAVGSERAEPRSSPHSSPRGVSSGNRRLVQSSYTDSAILPAGRGHPRWRSQPYPVNPTRGNTLVAFMNGSIYHPHIDCGSIVAVHDTAGGRWYKAGESGPDDRTGINISCWVCDAAAGGPTLSIPTFSNASQQLACLLLEFANLPKQLRVTNVSRRTFGGDLPPLTTGRLWKRRESLSGSGRMSSSSPRVPEHPHGSRSCRTRREPTA